MNREEQIEEMAKIIDEMYWVYDTTAGDIAEELYNAGYRKAEEIRKETAKEIEQFKTSNQNAIDKINELQKEINALQEENRRLDEYVSCTLSAQEFDEEIKQAKIDVLNELKEKIVEHMGDREYMGVKYKQGVFSESEIDEMIAEVKECRR